jgi:glycosyltransferase involved in cell wall biosynthesis
MEDSGVTNTTIAVRPAHHKRPIALEEGSARWKPYVCIPTNIGLPTAGKLLATALVRVIAEEHRAKPFDLIHAHAALPCGHAAMLLSRRFSLPLVVTVHGLDVFFTRQARGFIGRWCRTITEEVYRSARAVVCISEKVREQICGRVNANATVIYNGVDITTFAPRNASEQSLMVLSVGNLIPIKGHAGLLRAIAQLSNTIPACTLEIIGDGPERKKLSKLASQLGITGKVTFRGRQDKAYVADAMRRCSVFALPSAYEGLGCVYLEAMACGKPVIGCYGQGIDEIVQPGVTGLLVRPENETELTEVLRKLLGDYELRQRIGGAARDTIFERCTLQHQARQLAAIYHWCVQ